MMTRRKWLVLSISLIAVALVGLASSIWYVHSTYVSLQKVIRDSYAVWNVAEFVIIYMEEHDGQWPRSWDDLEEPYQKANRQPYSFDELRNRVSVDWDADPAELSQAATGDGDQPFRVIWLSDGSLSHWEGLEPNRIIYDYLRKAQEKQETDRTPNPLP